MASSKNPRDNEDFQEENDKLAAIAWRRLSSSSSRAGWQTKMSA